MIHAKPDLFEMTPADNEKMRAIARRQVRAKIEHIAKPVAPQKTNVFVIEDAMIESMVGDVRRTGYADKSLKWNQIKHHEAQLAILDALDTPQTASQIARQIGKSDHNVSTILRRMLAQGRVSRGDRTGNAAAVWTRTEAAYGPPAEIPMPSAVKGDQTRANILEALIEPMTAVQIAKLISRHPTYTAEVLRGMIGSGLVAKRKIKGQRSYMFERVCA